MDNENIFILSKGIIFKQYLCDNTVYSMLDTVSTRLQEVYARWNRRTEVKRNPESDTTPFSIKGKIFIQGKKF